MPGGGTSKVLSKIRARVCDPNFDTGPKFMIFHIQPASNIGPKLTMQTWLRFASKL